MPHVESQGLSIWYEETGSGPPIVLGHSFLCSGRMWRHQVEALSARYRVINIDFRGHGKSEKVSEPFTGYDAVEDVVAVLDELGIEKATWCGLSIGGMIAMRAALVVPDRVERLILIDTDAGTEPLLKRAKNNLMALGAKFLGLQPFLTPISQLMFGATTLRENKALVSEWKVEFARAHVPSMLRALKWLMKRDSIVDRLSEIGVPTLVIVGSEDQSLPPARSRTIHEHIPDSRLIEIERAGHLTPLERPEAVNEAILSFMEAVRY